MRISFDQIREQNRLDVDRSNQLSLSTQQRLDARVVILRTSHYSRYHRSADDAEPVAVEPARLTG